MIITGFVLIDQCWNPGLVHLTAYDSPHDPASIAVHPRGSEARTRRQTMFSAYCKQCGSVLLLGPANIVAIQNSSEGIVVHFQCHAGHRGVWLASARSDRPALHPRSEEHAPHRVTISATSGRPAGRSRRPSDRRPSPSARPLRLHVAATDGIRRRDRRRRAGRAPRPGAALLRARWAHARWAPATWAGPPGPERQGPALWPVRRGPCAVAGAPWARTTLRASAVAAWQPVLWRVGATLEHAARSLPGDPRDPGASA